MNDVKEENRDEGRKNLFRLVSVEGQKSIRREYGRVLQMNGKRMVANRK